MHISMQSQLQFWLSLSLLQIPEGRVRGGVCVGRNDRPTVTGGAGEPRFLGAMPLPRGLILFFRVLRH